MTDGLNYSRHLPDYVPAAFPIFVTWNLKGAMPARAVEALEQKRRILESQPARKGEIPADRIIRESKILFAIADRYLDEASQGPMHLKDAKAAKIVEDAILFGVGERYELFAWCVMANHVHVLLKPSLREIKSSGRQAGEREVVGRQAGKPDLQEVGGRQAGKPDLQEVGGRQAGKPDLQEVGGRQAGKPDLQERQAGKPDLQEVGGRQVEVVETPRWDLPKVMQGIKGYTAWRINELRGTRGQAFWQDESYDHWSRDEDEMFRIIEYIENNPVKAGLCSRADAWPWSSARLRGDWRPGAPFGGEIGV
jgi:REP element-mobilizing transposase RayT